MRNKDINKRLVESIVKSGTFDSIKLNRATLLGNLERIWDAVNSAQKNNIEGQVSLFDVNSEIREDEINMISFEDFKLDKKLKMEKEFLGMYISGHPLREYGNLGNITTHNVMSLREMEEDYEYYQHNDNVFVKIAGIIASITYKTTRTNDMMLFLSLEDEYGEVEVIVFPATLKKTLINFNKDEAVYVKGTMQIKEDDKIKIIAKDITLLKDEINIDNKTLYIRVEGREDVNIKKVKDIIIKNKGDNKVVFYDFVSQKSFQFDKFDKVKISDDIFKEICVIFGEKNVVIK